MRGGLNYALVKADKEDLTLTYGSLKIEVIPRGGADEGKYLVQSGVVVGLPSKVLTIPKFSLRDNKLSPMQQERLYYDAHRKFDVRIIIQEGDIVLFHQLSISDQYWVKDDIYAINHDLIYCLIRNGEIICLDNNLLVEPIMEVDEEFVAKSGIIIKPDLNIVMNAPNSVVKSVLNGGVKKDPRFEKKPKYLSGYVRYLGRPSKRDYYKGIYRNLKVGDKIIYSPCSDVELKVNGEVLYRMNHDDIYAIDKR